MSIVFLNGDFMPKDEAKISPDDRGFLLADGVYEVTPFYEGVPFAIDEHLARLERGEEADFEALCGAHPEHEDELRRAQERWSAFHDAAAQGPVSLFRGRGERAAVAPGPWDVTETF